MNANPTSRAGVTVVLVLAWVLVGALTAIGLVSFLTVGIAFLPLAAISAYLLTKFTRSTSRAAVPAQLAGGGLGVLLPASLSLMEPGWPC